MESTHLLPGEDGGIGQSAATACAECGAAPLAGPFCHRCGQRVAERLTFTTVMEGLRDQFVTLDFSIWRTLKRATVHPGRLVAEYLEGRRDRYTNPLAYVILSVTLYVVSLRLTGFEPLSLEVAGSVDPLQYYQSAMTALGPAMAYLVLITLIPTAWAQHWALGRRSGHNAAECYVFFLFVGAQALLPSVALIWAGVYDTGWGATVAVLVGIGIISWGMQEFHRISSPLAVAAAAVLLMSNLVMLEVLGGGIVEFLSLWGSR